MDANSRDSLDKSRCLDIFHSAAWLKLYSYFTTVGKAFSFNNSFRTIALITNILIIVINIAWSSSTLDKISTVKSYCPEPPYAPVVPALRYHERVRDLYAPSPYAGNVSSPDLVAAWESLRTNQLWRATKSELELAGAWRDDALRMEHGGYMAIYRVYHEIHCLDWIKRDWSVYKDEKPEFVEHLDHCLKSLREGAMCRADLTIGSWYWWPSERSKRVRRPDAPRQCLVWDSLEDYMETRRVDIKNGVPESPLNAEGIPIFVAPKDPPQTLKTSEDKED